MLAVQSNTVQYVVPMLYPKQLLFCQSKTKYTLYGGARGGGKSFVAREKAIDLCLKYNGFQCLFMRRTYPQLERNHLDAFRQKLFGIAKYNTQRKCFIFPNGSIIQFGYCDREQDALQYQGLAYDAIFLDEATFFTFGQFSKISTSLRPSDTVDRTKVPSSRMYLTANPGGVGHTWVKRLFIDREYTKDEDPDDYSFIQAFVFDNEFLMKEAPTYVKQLEALPEKEKQAMLYGDWNAFEGLYFDEFDETLHTYEDKEIEIKPHWRRFRTRDYGLDKTACYWIAMDENENCYVYRELWESNLIVKKSGDIINSMTLPEDTPFLDIMPPDLWNRNGQTGRSVVDTLIQECHQNPTKANNDMYVGCLMMKEFLQVNPETGFPRLRISKSCPHLIDSIKMIQHDEKKVNLYAKDPHELTHSVDAIRYFCTSYTFAPPALDPASSKIPFDIGAFATNSGPYEEDSNDGDDFYFSFERGYFI